MLSYRRVAITALVAFAGLLTGCPNAENPPEPSLLWVGADIGTVTSGGGVQGEAYVAWNSRLSEHTQVVAIDDATGEETVVFDTATSSDCIADVKTITVPDPDTGDPIEVFNFPIDFDPDSCVDDGAYVLQATPGNSYVVRGLRGEGRCDTSELGVYLYPEECDELEAGVIAVPPAGATIGPDVTVASGENADVAFTLDSTTVYDWAVGIYDAGTGDFTACDPSDAETPDTVCTYVTTEPDAAGLVTGTLTVPAVTADTTVTIYAINGADDGLGDLYPGDETATITVQ